jgi:hypothetical protein
MARGWEREPAAAAAAGMAKDHRDAVSENTPDPEELQLIRKKESIQLSRVRVSRELKSSQNPRYKAMMVKALADLDAQLAVFKSD